MKMRFKISAEALNDALDTVSIVPARPVTPNRGEAGYLFVVRGDSCVIYSGDANHVARAPAPITDVEGEGAFIYPAAYVDSFKYVSGDISFEIENEGEKHIIRYAAESGIGAERASFDPQLITPFDADLAEATDERDFHVAILREAMAYAKPFIPKHSDKHAEDHFKTLQVFDQSKAEWEKGNGYLYAANGTQAFYFYSEAFQGKGLAVHGQHIGALTAFLGKAEGIVKVRTGKRMTFLTDSKDRVLGVGRYDKMHGKFVYYSLKQDKIVLDVPVPPILKAMKYIRAELNRERERVRIQFTPSQDGTGAIQFQFSDGSNKATSFDVPVKVLQNETAGGFGFYVNINMFMELFSGPKGENITLRVIVIPADERRPKESAAFRTIDEFWLDEKGTVVAGSGVEESGRPEGAYQCRVTRFVPSMT